MLTTNALTEINIPAPEEERPLEDCGDRGGVVFLATLLLFSNGLVLAAFAPGAACGWTT